MKDKTSRITISSLETLFLVTGIYAFLSPGYLDDDLVCLHIPVLTKKDNEEESNEHDAIFALEVFRH